MTSMVICHQQIQGHMNTYWAEIYKQKPLIILKKIHLFQLLSNNLYRTHLTSCNNKRGLCSKMTPPFFFKVTDVTRVHGSPQQVWLPLSERHFMQHWLVERTRVWRVYSATPAAGHGWAGTHQQGWGIFSYLLSKNWQEPNLESWRQEICDDPSSVRSGTVVLQSVAPGPMACRAHWMMGHTISSLQHGSVRNPWMT